MVVTPTDCDCADLFDDGLDEVTHDYSPVMMSMSCVPSTNDPPRVSKANRGTTPCSSIPMKPTMMQAMRMTDKAMCESTAVGFMWFSLDAVAVEHHAHGVDVG